MPEFVTPQNLLAQADPSSLTTEALLREIAHLRDLLEGRSGAIEASLNDYRSTHEAIHRDVVHVAIENLHILMETRLADREKRYDQRYETQNDAVKAAFSAQETAVQAALIAADRAVTTAIDAADKAVAKAETLNDRRFETVTDNTTDIRSLTMRLEEMVERVGGLDRLTDAKFITFRTLIDSQAEKVALALAASDKAVSKAEAANEKRFEGVNEFRGQLADQAQTLMPRTEATALSGALAARIDATVAGIESAVQDMKSRLDRAEGKSGGYQASAGALIAAVGLIATLITIVTGIILVVN